MDCAGASSTHLTTPLQRRSPPDMLPGIGKDFLTHFQNEIYVKVDPCRIFAPMCRVR